MKCNVNDGAFAICQLEAGHVTRHKDGNISWVDAVVMKAREGKCLDEFDGSICLQKRGHKSRHTDGVGSRNGPVSWTDESKAQMLREREGK